VQSFWLPKAGNTAAEYEDALYPRKPGELSNRRVRLAVADGASEGMFSGSWAAILTRLFCRTSPTLPVEEFLGRAHREWQEWTAAYLQRRERQNRPLQWFEEPGFQRGAFATLLGLTLFEHGRWEALALGDSCLFQMRGADLLAAFPLERSADFNSRPFLIASNPTYNAGLSERVARIEGDWQAGDQWLLMTDALACWFMQACEAGRAPWDLVRQHAQPEDFTDWIAALRADHHMRNDDVTLMSVEIE
jgi:hypothetical protein